MRFVCISRSTTSPINPAWELQYGFRVNGQNVSNKGRYMANKNELMVAGIVMEDSLMNITCIVSEEVDGFNLSNQNTRHFRMRVLEKIKRK